MNDRTDLDYLMCCRSDTLREKHRMHQFGERRDSRWTRASRAARKRFYRFSSQIIAWLGGQLFALSQGLQSRYLAEAAKAEH